MQAIVASLCLACSVQFSFILSIFLDTHIMFTRFYRFYSVILYVSKWTRIITSLWLSDLCGEKWELNNFLSYKIFQLRRIPYWTINMERITFTYIMYVPLINLCNIYYIFSRDSSVGKEFRETESSLFILLWQRVSTFFLYYLNEKLSTAPFAGICTAPTRVSNKLQDGFYLRNYLSSSQTA